MYPIYIFVGIIIIIMTNVSVPEYIRNNGQSTLGEPLIWDSDTKTGICTGLKFNALSDGSRLIDDSHANYHDDWNTPTSYSLISIFRGVVFIRINFKVFDENRGCKIIRGYYMKSSTLKLLALAMGTHSRLGADSRVLELPGPEDADVWSIISERLSLT